MNKYILLTIVYFIYFSQQPLKSCHPIDFLKTLEFVAERPTVKMLRQTIKD